jgi:hypothetical protein
MDSYQHGPAEVDFAGCTVCGFGCSSFEPEADPAAELLARVPQQSDIGRVMHMVDNDIQVAVVVVIAESGTATGMLSVEVGSGFGPSIQEVTTAIIDGQGRILRFQDVSDSVGGEQVQVTVMVEVEQTCAPLTQAVEQLSDAARPGQIFLEQRL